MLAFLPIISVAVIQVFIAQTNAETCPVKDTSPICPFVTPAQCKLPAFQKVCPLKCNAFIKDCSGDWSCVVGQCVQVVSTDRHRTWSSARVACNVLGAPHTSDLVIPNKDNLQNVVDYITNTTKPARYWIGGSDLYAAGEWYWGNGTPVIGYTGQPKGDRECLYINTDDGVIGKDFQDVLGNEGCGATLAFVCEKILTN